jgi:hypothetical protein
MDIIKLILLVVGILALFVVGYWLIGFIFGLFWLLVYAGIIGLVGYGGYKLLFGRSSNDHSLEDKTPISIAEFEGTDRALEEYRRKYLTK